MYLIQVTIYKYGQSYHYTNEPKKLILEKIEFIKKYGKENTYMCISATNLDTGETRIVWDNRKMQHYSVIHNMTESLHGSVKNGTFRM